MKMDFGRWICYSVLTAVSSYGSEQVGFVCRQRRAHSEGFSVEENVGLVGLDVLDLSLLFGHIITVKPSVDVLTILATVRIAYGCQIFAVLGSRLGAQG